MEENSLESASREAYFSRVETFTISFGMLPLWDPGISSFPQGSNPGPSVFPADRERCAELRRALSAAHERFCFWPDSPCPERFALLPLDEPRVLLQEFLERFQSLSRLELQLPSLRPEELGNMSLSEERIRRLLELIQDELECGREGEKPPGKFSMESPQGHAVPASILALCGWNCRWEKSPSPSLSRPVSRGWDSPGSMDRGELEVSSPSLRSRPVTRSMGQGDTMEVPSSPIRRAKRARLCSSGGSDASTRSFFHPSSQHRDWCPWVSAREGQDSLEDAASHGEKAGKAEPGWKMVLDTLLGTRRGEAVPDTEPVSLSEKSCKVFRIFRQWESMNSS
ncbi:nuclear-interacting partner of ALK [Manacus vitellinus]|uniref:nuclear-interacting partner of ALK n=1 Tax=Manacus vitellinus TaxID=328815 RepID=UPI00115F4A70|nr:nuclear-interacting partner of ALK [Manacus vitellinus]